MIKNKTKSEMKLQNNFYKTLISYFAHKVTDMKELLTNHSQFSHTTPKTKHFRHNHSLILVQLLY